LEAQHEAALAALAAELGAKVAAAEAELGAQVDNFNVYRTRALA
jgi:hypothetical protein